MSTLEEKKEILNKRIAEISKVYEENARNAEEVYATFNEDARKLIESKKPLFLKKQKMIFILAEMNHAEMSRFVNRRFIFFMDNFKELATYLLEVADDIDTHIPIIEKHRDFFHTVMNSLDKQNTQNVNEQERKEQDQKRLKSLTGGMYG